jgi:hypothetical protein
VTFCCWRPSVLKDVPENCWFFVSIIQEAFMKNYGGRYESGSLNHPELGKERCERILTEISDVKARSEGASVSGPIASANTESTLHSDGDHLDHTTDVDRMAEAGEPSSCGYYTEAGEPSPCGYYSPSVSSHDPESEPEEVPEEPDEPDEPDLSSEDVSHPLMEDVDLNAAVGAKAAAVAHHDETGPDSDSASTDSDASVMPTDGTEMGSTPGQEAYEN